MNGRSCSPKHGPKHFTVLKNLFLWIVWSFSKTFELMAGPCSPKHGPVLFTVWMDIVFMVILQPCKNIQIYGWAALPNIPCHGPAHFPALKNRFVLMLCRHSTTFKRTAGRVPPNTAQLISRCWRTFFIWMVWNFSKTFELMAGPCSPKHGPVLFTVWMDIVFMVILQPCKNIQIYGWAALPNIPCHGPAHFPALKNRFVLMLCRHSTTFKRTAGRVPPNTAQLISRCWRTFFIWMVWNFSKTFELMAGPCSPKHGPVLFTVLKNLFVLMFCSHVKTFKFMAGPRSPTFSVTAQLISRRWRILSFWCCADFQHCSTERMVVLPQTRSRAFHGVDDYFYRVGMKLFKNIRTYGLVVLPQTRPSSFHGVEKPFRLNIKRSSLWLGRAPQHPLSRPSLFRGVEESFRFDVMQTLNNVETKGFSKTLELMVGPCSSIHGPVLFTVLKNFFVWMLCSHVKTFKFMAGPHFPTSSVTAKLILRRWRIVLRWCCADIQQRSNERIFVLPQTRSSSFHGVENFSHLDGRKLFKNTRVYGWAVLPETRPSSFHGVEELFRLDVT